MIYKTHHIAGVVAVECVALHYHAPILSAISACFVGFFIGPAADIDQPQSFVGQRTQPISTMLQGIGVRHRSFTHSLLMLGILYLFCDWVGMSDFWKWAVFWAYASHPIIDLFNAQGVELLFPFKYRFKLLPDFIAIRTESAMEAVFRGICSALMFFLFFHLNRETTTDIPVIGEFMETIHHIADSFTPNFLLEAVKWLKS